MATQQPWRFTRKSAQSGEAGGVDAAAAGGGAATAGAKRTAADDISEVISQNERFYNCGDDFDLCGLSFAAATRPFLRVTIDCASPIELQVWSSDVLSHADKLALCGFCGQKQDLVPVNDAGEATVLLPLCTACHAQHHKARSSGRPNPKFDTGGRRATKQAEAAARVVQVADEKVAIAAAAAAPAAGAVAATAEPKDAAPAAGLLAAAGKEAEKKEEPAPEAGAATTAPATQVAGDVRGAQAKAAAAGPAAGRAAAASITAAAKATPAGGAAGGGGPAWTFKAWAEPGAKTGGKATAAAVRVALQQHEAAAAVAEPKATPEDATDVLADAAVAADEARIAMDSGGAAEAMDEDDAAVTFPEGAPLPPLAKDASPPRGRGARGSKSARAARENPDEVRNSGDKPTRRLPRAAAANNTAVEMIRAGGYSTAAATAAQRRRASGGSS
jgi:hypothetical protein